MTTSLFNDAEKIERIRVYVTKTSVPEYSWSPAMPDLLTTNTIVRITTSDGTEGASGVFSCTEHGVDRAVAEGMRPLLKGLIGRYGLRREELWHWMQMRRLSVANTAIAGLDIALWDLTAKRAGLPLYLFLGGSRDRVKAYASTQVLKGPQAYADHVAELRAQGFKAFKFHYDCEPDADLEMMRLVHAAHGNDGLDFMFDADGFYSPKEALRVAREMQDMGYAWLEAPFPDHNLDAYRELRQRVDIPVLPAGNTLVDLPQIAHAVRFQSWDAIRIDATISGGVTPARKIMALAEAHGMNVEFQSWGCALSMAANLHLMLAFSNCRYFEMPVPYSEFQTDALGRIEVDENGYVRAPDAPGLGLSIDWDYVESISEHTVNAH